jgi:S1-C subfamily serine protease
MRDFFTARAIVVIAAAIVALPPVAGSAAAQAVPDSRAEISLSFAPIVKRAAPAVVNVYAQRIVRQPGFRRRTRSVPASSSTTAGFIVTNTT